MSDRAGNTATDLFKTARALENAAFADTLTTTDVIYRSLSQGSRYTFTHYFEDVGSDETVSIFAELPESAEYPVTVGTRQIISQGAMLGTVSVNVTVDTGGATQQSRNDRISTSPQPDSDVEWSTGGTYSDKGELVNLFNPGGTSIGQRTGSLGATSSAHIEPGANILWELESFSGDNDMLFTVIYSEDSNNQ